MKWWRANKIWANLYKINFLKGTTNEIKIFSWRNLPRIFDQHIFHTEIFHNQILNGIWYTFWKIMKFALIIFVLRPKSYFILMHAQTWIMKKCFDLLHRIQGDSSNFFTGCLNDFSLYVFHPYGAGRKQRPEDMVFSPLTSEERKDSLSVHVAFVKFHLSRSRRYSCDKIPNNWI